MREREGGDRMRERGRERERIGGEREDREREDRERERG